MEFSPLPYSASNLREILRCLIIGTISSNVGHQINNNLTGIIGYNTLAQQSRFDQDNTQRYLGRITECCSNAQKLIGAIHSVTENEHNKQLFLRDPADYLSQVIGVCESVFLPQHTFAFQCLDEDPFDLPDPGIKEILLHLVLSVMNCSKADNSVSVVCDSQSPFGVLKSMREIDHLYLIVRARDASEEIESTSDLFSKSGASRSAKDYLQKLRSHTAEFLAATWGGSIRQGRIRGGEYAAEVSFRRSRIIGASHEADFSESVVEKSHAPLRVLLLEDQEVIREFTETLLHEAGWKSAAFQHGGDLLDSLDHLPLDHYDIFLLDIYVPGVSGLEIGKRIRERAPEAKILFYSALADPEDLQRHFTLDDRTQFLPKPFSKSELIAKIEEMTARISTS